MTRHPFPNASPRVRRWQGLLACGLLLAGCAGTTPPDAHPASAAPPATAATAPAPQTLEKPVPAVAAPDSDAVEESNIFFAPGATMIDAVGEAKLRRHADQLKAKRKKTVTLVGHTSNSGSRSFNLATTDQRVAAVSKQLKSHGVWARQIRPHSVIRESLPAGCRDADCSRMTRRVELVFSP